MIVNHLIECAHIIHADDVVKLHIVGKRFEQLWLRHGLSGNRRIAAVRTHQQHALLVWHQVKHLEIGRARHQRAIETVDNIVKFIIGCVQVTYGTQ